MAVAPAGTSGSAGPRLVPPPPPVFGMAGAVVDPTALPDLAVEVVVPATLLDGELAAAGAALAGAAAGLAGAAAGLAGAGAVVVADAPPAPPPP